MRVRVRGHKMKYSNFEQIFCRTRQIFAGISKIFQENLTKCGEKFAKRRMFHFMSTHPQVFDKYIFNQVLAATLVCVLLFIIIWIAPETLLHVIQKTLNGTYSVEVAMQVLLYEIPKILNKALPIGLFLGTLYTFDRMSKDSELTIFRSVGLSFWRIQAPVIALSVLVTIACLVVNDKISPFSCNKLTALKHEMPNSNFVYILKDNQERPKQIIILPFYNKKSVKEPVVMTFSGRYYSDVSVLKDIIIGSSARIQEDKFVINLGKEYSVNEDGIFENIVDVANKNILQDDDAKILYQLSNYKLHRERDLTNAQMIHYLKLLKKEDLQDDFRENLNKLLQRYTHSLMCVLFAILGCLLGFSQPREQRLVGFTVAIGLTFLYYITLPFIDMLAEKNFLNPVVTALVHPAMLLIAVIAAKEIKDV